MELRAIGIGIAIDDFGTGYSSLSYLQQFPATSIKIDRSFVSGLDEAGDIGLGASILSIGKALGMTTVAEGVETAEQLRAARARLRPRPGLPPRAAADPRRDRRHARDERMVDSAEFRRGGVPLVEAS